MSTRRVTDGASYGKSGTARVGPHGFEGVKMDRMAAIEERLAHLMRAVEDLSDVVARQSGEIDRLARLNHLLMEREAGREADSGEGIALADQKPPHW